MMEAVAEQRSEDEPGTDIEPAPPALPADPEELRRFRDFQEFQQFQEFQRFQELQRSGELEPTFPTPEQPAPQRRQVPGWLRSAVGKVISALLVLAAVIIGLAWAINHFLGGPEPETPAEQAKQGGKKETATELYASDPYEAVRRVYDDIAQENIDHACLRFAEGSAAQFAQHLGYPSCEDAVRSISAEVRAANGANAYAESLPSSTPGERYQELSGVEPGGTITVDSCAAAVDPAGINGGPALGVFTVTKLPNAYGEQWSITGHTAGPEKCPRSSS